MKRRSWWGWGIEGEGLSPERRAALGALLGTQMDVGGLVALSPPRLEDVALPPMRARVPSALEHLVVSDPRERAGHTYGKAYRDVVRGLAGDLAPAPDVVALPESEADVERLLAWADEEGYAVIPYGGGSSVVGGVEARCREDYPAVVSLDLRKLSGVLELDRVSRAARIAAGTFGPDLEAALAADGLTLRHFPQSFEYSTLGGWLATRAGGHFATLHTHIDDFVESLRLVTPRGGLESRRLPGSGAGPSPDRFFLGSEGALGIITSAWMRVMPRPVHRASQTFAYPDVYAAAEAARALAQSGLHPANARVLDRWEALINGVGDGTRAFLLVAFESWDHPVDASLARAREIALSAGGEPIERAMAGALDTTALADAEDEQAAQRWRKMFLRGPYLRDALAEMGMIVETFETAITWDRFESFHREVREAAVRTLAEVAPGGAVVTSRLTHVYPDGAAPYFTVIAPGPPGALVAAWDAVKVAVSETILTAGGTITHHHAVGRDHQPYYARQVPPLFGEVLQAAKRQLDPRGILNPGCLLAGS